jgi:hypothetical protein
VVQVGLLGIAEASIPAAVTTAVTAGLAGLAVALVRTRSSAR